MADYQVSEHTKLTGGGDFAAMSGQIKVWLWDCGPPKPTLPIKPKLPPGKEGSPEYDVALRDFQYELEDYNTAIDRYRINKKEYDKFVADYGGPYEREFWSCDATDALANDDAAVKDGRQIARRWFISNRNRGWEHLKNLGLPQAMKPGHGQAELKRREAEGEADLAALRRRDPVFGSNGE